MTRTRHAKFTDFIPMQKELAESKATITRLTAERDEALSMIRIAYDAGYHQAECGLPNHGDIDRAATEALNKRIGVAVAAAYDKAAQVVDACNAEGPYQAIGAANRIRALATEPGTTALAEMLDAETRACAEVIEHERAKRLGDGHDAASTNGMHSAMTAILARIDQRKGAWHEP